MRILLIEDDDLVRNSLTNFLETVLGHDIVSCNTAEKGLRNLEHSRFSLIITDLLLPGMNGIQFIHKAKERLGESPAFILISGTGDETTEEAVRQEHILYLKKPFDIDAIVQVINRIPEPAE